jgi:lipid-A-disaccharide synthase
MLVIFPFEETFYRDHGMSVSYVGHPLLDRFDERRICEECEKAYGEWGFSPLYPVMGLFPGSREGEVRALLPTLLRSAEAIRQRFPRMQFLLGQAPEVPEGLYEEILEGFDAPVKCVRTGICLSMGICDLAVVASGTATLELALLGVPMIIVYRVSRLTFALGRLLVRVPSIGMVNLVSRKAVVPELIQEEVNETTLCEYCWPFFTKAIYYSHIKNELAKVRQMLGQPGASARAARTIHGLLHKPEHPDERVRRGGP